MRKIALLMIPFLAACSHASRGPASQDDGRIVCQTNNGAESVTLDVTGEGVAHARVEVNSTDEGSKAEPIEISGQVRVKPNGSDGVLVEPHSEDWSAEFHTMTRGTQIGGELSFEDAKLRKRFANLHGMSSGYLYCNVKTLKAFKGE